MFSQEAFHMLSDAESLGIAEDPSVKNLNREARNLKKQIQAFNDASEWGERDSSITAEAAMKLLEEGSNALKAVVRTAQSAKSVVALARAEQR